MYDAIIIGGGPAGITAAIYAKRAGKSVLLLEKFMLGGQVSLIGEIENYTGFEKIDGFTLSNKFLAQATSLGVKFVFEEAQKLELNAKIKKVVTNKNTYEAKSIILALGSHTRNLGIEGEQKFKGKGVSYCAICDGNFFKNKPVAVVGSGDAAFSDAAYLSGLCSQVYLLTKENLSLNNYAENEFDQKPNVKLIKGAISKKIEGDENVKSITILQDEKEETLSVDAVFVAIGRRPDTTILQGQIELNDKGYIKTDSNMHTNIQGVFVCGDVREGSIRQIATAVGDGAVAGTEAVKYISIFDHQSSQK